ncbi:LysR family transcriptional regulator [uncultured Hydrogenophaga sp.]|jgi:DNA-binding transcriptional LysR family regulator|uniref:LysR family transcriptional regulator n=1 Tax=uncultured Hydrogenophaga sp. TaxID=199683 RepID=UPI0025867F23|nr:LysR family transcriptional regulator [uncultured Hydrogenophaga sp.]
MKNADIKQLELMCELIETQSLSEAAARLGMTPSAASQSLSRLRATFGEEVYVRQGNAYRLTPHGEQVMGGVRAIVRHWNEALQASGDFDPSTCELRFAVACVAHTASPDLVRLHADMRRLAPRATLDFQVPLHNAVDVQSLRAGKLDVLCASAPPPPDMRDVHHELLCTHALTHVVLGRGHPRIGESMTLAQYLGEEHLVAHYRNLDPASRSPLDAALLAHGHAARRATYVQSLWTALHMVSRSDYLLTVSAEGARVLERYLSEVRSLPLPPDMPAVRSELHMIWHERTHRSRPHQWLRERLREVCAGTIQ